MLVKHATTGLYSQPLAEHFQEYSLKKIVYWAPRGWLERVGSAVKTLEALVTGPWFGSQNLGTRWLLPLLPVAKDPTPSSDF